MQIPSLSFLYSHTKMEDLDASNGNSKRERSDAYLKTAFSERTPAVNPMFGVNENMKFSNGQSAVAAPYQSTQPNQLTPRGDKSSSVLVRGDKSPSVLAQAVS
jgi:hypothetical protein